MTNYNLAEFKAWLAEDESRKKGLRWKSYYKQKSLDALISLIDVPINNQPFNYDSHQPYQQVIKQWKALIDEREREREREQGGDPSMVKCSKCKASANNLFCPVCIEQRVIPLKQKLTNFLYARKQTLQQEIQLIKEVLNE